MRQKRLTTSRATYEDRECRSKVRFDTWDEALPVALAAARVAPQRIYPCDYCSGWHLTSHQAVTVPRQKART
jgi:hypothetical protein